MTFGTEPRRGVALLEQLPLVTYVAPVDDPCSVEYVSPQIEALLGFPAEDWVAVPGFWLGRVANDDRELFRERCVTVHNTRESVHSDYRLVARDGREVWVRDVAAIVTGHDGTPSVHGFLTDITHEKELELALARERAQTDAFFRDSSVGMAITDAEGRYVRVNDALARMHGVLAADHIGRTLREVQPTLADYVDPLLDEVWRTGEALHGRELDIELGPGNAANVLVSYFPVDAAGAKHFGGIVVDVTELHRALEDRAATAREHLRLIEKLPLVIYVNALGGGALRHGRRTSYVSPQVEKLFGHPPAEWFADDTLWDRLVHPDDLAIVRDAEAHADGEQIESEYRIVRPDGSMRWILDTMYTERDEDGNALFEQGFAIDVTDRKRAEQAECEAIDALRASEEQFRAVFGNALDAMVLADDEGRYVDVNSAACELFGMTREELLLLSPPNDSADADCRSPMLHDLRADGKLAGSAPIVRSDGTRREVEYTATANVLPGRHLAVLRDVTERKQLEHALWEAQRLESVGTLAGGIAHDFNNMLMAISGYTSLLLGRLPPGSVERHHAGEIEQAAARAAKLTAQLLAFGRRQVLQPREVDLGKLVVDLSPMIVRVVGSEVTLSIEPEPDLRPVLADPGQMEQVILNIAVNASEAMPAGGHVVIGARNVDVEHDVQATDGVTARELSPGQYVAVSITDSGQGMDAETLEHVFEPFFTTKPVGLGEGLGLSTAYGIVKQSGGTIVAQSSAGSGTTFRIYLPAVSATPDPNGGHGTEQQR